MLLVTSDGFQGCYSLVFPKGSIIAGFRRQQNLGEMIAPVNPKDRQLQELFKAVSPVSPGDPAAYMKRATFRQWTMSGHCMME